MIYLVTNQTVLFEDPDIKIISVEESLRLLESINIVGLDTETNGLDCHTGTLLILQLGCFDFQIVIDCTTIDILRYKEYLESDRLFIGWNLKFDLKWLYKYHIVPQRVYDGFLAEKLMWLGYPKVLSPEVWENIRESRYDYVPAKDNKKPYYIMYTSLKKAGEMYLGIELDKSIRGQISYRGLDKEVVTYSALDVKYLEKIKEGQEKTLKEKDLSKAVDVLNRFTLSLAYKEFCGVKMDRQKWLEKCIVDEGKMAECKERMNKWLIENFPDSKYIYIDNQGDLFAENPFDTTPKVSINWNSTKQVIPIFKKFGVDVEVTVDDGGKESINEKVIAPQKSKCSLISLYLEYQGFKKLVSTYGRNVLEQINKDTGRLYTNFNIAGTDTVRISSGGKDKSRNIKYVNFLNFPKDALTRSCFIAEEGNKWISIDYSGQESFIMGDISNDKAILHELNYGDKDLHTLTAKIVFDYIPKDMTAKQVKENFHKERDLSKGYEFAFNYSGNDYTIKNNFGLTDEEAKRIYNSYMSGFDGLKRYQEFRKKDWWQKGYIDLNPKFGFKAYIYDYSFLKEEWDRFKEEGFWDYYRQMKKDSPKCDTVNRVKEYFKRKSDTDRQSVNYPIQHTGALCYMISMINFFEYLRKNNLLFKVLITITPYDEINCEAPGEVAENIAQELYGIMVRAGAYFVKKCKLDADISRLPDGNLPTYWIH